MRAIAEKLLFTAGMGEAAYAIVWHPSPVLICFAAMMMGFPVMLHADDHRPRQVSVAAQWEVERRKPVKLAPAQPKYLTYTEAQMRVEARLRRFPLAPDQRDHLVRTMGPDVVAMDDAELRSIIQERSHVLGIGTGGVSMDQAAQALHAALAPAVMTLAPVAPMPCGYCTALNRKCACRR